MRVIRLAAGLLGGLFLFLAVAALFAEYVGESANADDPATRIFIACIFLLPGLILLGFAARLRKIWVLVWVIGWVLALGGALQILYSFQGLITNQNLGDKIASVFWALVAPIQLSWAVRLIKLARRRSTPRMKEFRLQHSQAPVLYLRPFAADSKMSRVTTRTSWMSQFFFNTKTDEELVAGLLGEIGPCIAVGRPDEKNPQLGFSRVYEDDDWKTRVVELMARARLVVLMGGSSPNFLWELQRVVELVSPERLVLLIPADASEAAAFEQVAKEVLPRPLPTLSREARLPGRTFRAAVYFEPDWTPHFAVGRSPGHFRQPLTQVTTPKLKMALRPVYERLNVKWQQPPLVVWRVLYEAMVVGLIVYIVASVITA